MIPTLLLSRPDVMLPPYCLLLCCRHTHIGAATPPPHRPKLNCHHIDATSGTTALQQTWPHRVVTPLTPLAPVTLPPTGTHHTVSQPFYLCRPCYNTLPSGLRHILAMSPSQHNTALIPLLIIVTQIHCALHPALLPPNEFRAKKEDCK